MNEMNTTKFFGVWALLLALLFACDKDTINALTVSPGAVAFPKEGGNLNVLLATDAGSWAVANPAASWLSVSESTGTQKNAIINLTVTSKSLTARKDTLTFTAGNATPVKVVVSQAPSEYLYSLTADVNNLSFAQKGGTLPIGVLTDAVQWTMATNATWLQLSPATGGKGVGTVSVKAETNTGSETRTATLTLSADKAPAVQITVTQAGDLYPNYNASPLAPDATGMGSSARELAAKIKLGWNIGNTMEATGSETAWGNPLISKALIDLVKRSGFNAIRIPCAWNQYMENSATAKIKADWLNRVKTVVQYCVDNDMYVLLNIHWDGGWLEKNCTEEKKDENNAKQKAFWQQIATHLRDFDEHLLFASANEPNVENAVQMAVLNTYHQTFVDAVRATGGRNSHRVLVVQGPSTDIEKTNKLMTTLPTDNIANRMMVEIHYYTPWNFCGLNKDETWGKMFYYWGKDNHSATDLERNSSWGEEADVDKFFGLMKAQFVDKGIPVVMGEYAPTRRATLTGDALALHLKSRAYYLKYVTKQAIASGILPFYWDNGGTGNDASGIFNRTNLTVADQLALEALIQGTTK
jgi:endoglucanase